MNNSLAEVHPELVSEWSEKNLPLKPDDITFGSNKKVWWRGACGHEWQTSVKARSNGEKCPICSGARVIAGINDLATLEPLLVKQWSKKNKIKPTEVSIGSHKKVIWRCEKGHEWEAAVKSRTINKTGCPYCSHNKVLAGFNDLATLLPDIAAEWSDRNYLLLPTQVTVFANRKVWWKCKDCGKEWNTLISTRSSGSKCPYCSGYIFLKVGMFAMEKKAISVDQVKENFSINGEQAESVIRQLETIGVLGSKNEDGTHTVMMDKDAFINRVRGYQDLAERMRAVAASKNANLSDVTISKKLIIEENDHAVKTRVPGTWGEEARYVWLRKENIMEIHGGKTMLASSKFFLSIVIVRYLSCSIPCLPSIIFSSMMSL